MGEQVARKKAPTDHHRKPIWLTAGSLWGLWPWRDEDKEYFFFPATFRDSIRTITMPERNKGVFSF
jgi:hypothetical protein